MPAFALFGSSYISRLERFCNGDLQVPMSCHFFGAGGMKVTSISVPKYTQLLQLNPDYVFIQLGGNDISSTTIPREIFEKIIGCVDHLYLNGVKRVYVGEILRRGAFRDSHLTTAQFNRIRRTINKLLKKKLGSDFIMFPDIHFPMDYSPDQVHLSCGNSRKSGMVKYFHRLRKIIVSTQ